MRIGGGTNGGIADRSSVETQESAFAETNVVKGGDLHEEVVRMLAIDDGLAECGFTLLEQFGVLAGGDRSRLEREHRA